ncbi:AmmeMemoRadiSam system radical SAM enzyme [Pseudoxanthomonas koreensis]|uniref:AmmeMemoRadiSam system radical SAM enzyme n=1 Tax=Pseudoxanthomonas koreensis TaxID=266061 RepID=UPI0013919858|nr:AmmeMemoRadiSam system radical SAM enzyme [Pseudoxanthomonas koreensis]KAF1694140.1 AmmeMemoRadiSam system radical SAM enzyme [Pseudoxanthomonas koreensis]
MSVVPVPTRLEADDTAVATQLDAATRPDSTLARMRDDGRVQCIACAHRCVIPPGRRGACKVRFNRDGLLHVPWGYAGSLQINPIEQAPFMHAHAGEDVLTLGMLGCNLRCSYCQNWHLSQVLRDVEAPERPTAVSAEEIVATAHGRGIRVLLSSLNEPLITAEWAVELFARAKAAGMTTGIVSSGYATPEVLDFLRPHVDLVKIDLKTLSPQRYRSLGAHLQPVLDTLRMVAERGFWLELVTLVVPGWNDSEDELRGAARAIASVSPDIPWTLWNFHRDYRMRGGSDAGAADVVRAASIGRAEGLRYTYAGVQPGRVGDFENTRCPGCGTAVVERMGYQVTGYALDAAGQCAACATRVPGRWSPQGAVVRPAGLWFERQPQRFV